MNTYFKYLVLLLVVMSSYACSNNKRSNVDRYGFYPPVGSQLVLHDFIEVRAGVAGVYLQDGMNQQGKHSRFKPFCYIRYRNVSSQKRQIRPDTFVVQSSRIETRLIAQEDGQINHHPRFNSVSYRLVDSTPSDILEVATMRIMSRNNPNVYLLECGGVENSPAEVEPPRISDIRKALGTIMSLRLAQ